MSGEPARIEKSWGYELVFHADANYTCKHLVYTKRGVASSLHYHRQKHECFTILVGVFEIQVGHAKPVTYESGDVLVLPPSTKHRVRLAHRSHMGVIIEASSFDDPEDCVRVEPSEGT